MAMETLHKAYFFKTEQDKSLNRAFYFVLDGG